MMLSNTHSYLSCIGSILADASKPFILTPPIMIIIAVVILVLAALAVYVGWQNSNLEKDQKRQNLVLRIIKDLRDAGQRVDGTSVSDVFITHPDNGIGTDPKHWPKCREFIRNKFGHLFDDAVVSRVPNPNGRHWQWDWPLVGTVKCLIMALGAADGGRVSTGTLEQVMKDNSNLVPTEHIGSCMTWVMPILDGLNRSRLIEEHLLLTADGVAGVAQGLATVMGQTAESVGEIDKATGVLMGLLFKFPNPFRDNPAYLSVATVIIREAAGPTKTGFGAIEEALSSRGAANITEWQYLGCRTLMVQLGMLIEPEGRGKPFKLNITPEKFRETQGFDLPELPEIPAPIGEDGPDSQRSGSTESPPPPDSDPASDSTDSENPDSNPSDPDPDSGDPSEPATTDPDGPDGIESQRLTAEEVLPYAALSLIGCDGKPFSDIDPDAFAESLSNLVPDDGNGGVTPELVNEVLELLAKHEYNVLNENGNIRPVEEWTVPEPPEDDADPVAVDPDVEKKFRDDAKVLYLKTFPRPRRGLVGRNPTKDKNFPAYVQTVDARFGPGAIPEVLIDEVYEPLRKAMNAIINADMKALEPSFLKHFPNFPEKGYCEMVTVFKTLKTVKTQELTPEAVSFVEDAIKAAVLKGEPREVKMRVIVALSQLAYNRGTALKRASAPGEAKAKTTLGENLSKSADGDGKKKKPHKPPSKGGLGVGGGKLIPTPDDDVTGDGDGKVDAKGKAGGKGKKT